MQSREYISVLLTVSHPCSWWRIAQEHDRSGTFIRVGAVRSYTSDFARISFHISLPRMRVIGGPG
jgi:hypothetical protein